jgi:hypothetical protein
MVKQVKQLKVVKQLKQLKYPKTAKNGIFSDLKVSCSTLIALPAHPFLDSSTRNRGVK